MKGSFAAMKGTLGALAAVALVAACNGGVERVNVYGPGPSDTELGLWAPPDGGGEQSPQTAAATTGSSSSSSSGVGSGAGGDSGVGGGGQGCDTCADFLDHGGTDLCPDSQNAFTEIFYCACGSSCYEVCSATCASDPEAPSSACDSCMASNCPSQYEACYSN